MMSTSKITFAIAPMLVMLACGSSRVESALTDSSAFESELTFSLPQGQGEVTVRIENGGRVVVTDLADSAIGKVEVVQSAGQMGIPPQLDQACSYITSNLVVLYKSAATDEAQKARIKKTVRENSTQRVSFSLASYLEPSRFLAIVKSEARRAGIEHGELYIDPLELVDLSVTGTFRPQAMTTVFGEEGRLGSLETALSSASLSNGQGIFEIGAYDLLCDVLRGNLDLRVSYRAEAAPSPTVTDAAANEILADLREATVDFQQPRDAEGLRSNLVRGALLLQKSVSARAPRLSLGVEQLSTLHIALFDAESGTLRPGLTPSALTSGSAPMPAESATGSSRLSIGL